MSKLPRCILVTGGSGFVGRAILQKLDVSALPYIYTYTREPLEGRVDRGIKLDLSQPEAFERHKERLAAVTDLVHTAAFVPDKSRELSVLEDLHATVVQNVMIIEYLLTHLPFLERIVFVSSCYAALTDPSIGFYGVGKRVLEDIVHQYAKARRIPSVVLRFPQIYGPGETHGMYINKFAQLIINGQKIVLDEHASSRKDAVYIDDAAENIKASLFIEDNSTITISSSRSYSVEEIADKVVAAAAVPPDCIVKPRTMSSTVHTLHFRSDYQKYNLRLRYSLEDGIEKMVEYYRGKNNV